MTHPEETEDKPESPLSRLTEPIRELPMVKKIAETKTFKKLSGNDTLVFLLRLGMGVLGFFALWLVISVVYPSGKEPESSRTEALKSLRNSIRGVLSEKDPLSREQRLQQEAKHLNLPVSDYRAFVAAREHSTDALVSLPSSANPLSYVTWFYLSLTRQQRMALVWETLLKLISVLPHLTILFVGVKFLLEIPQRERAAKYQAWQVVHSAYDQKSSGARIEALQDLLEQKESLNGLSLEEGADLRKIQLPGADLRGANLFRANLSSVGLSDADLRTNLSSANLSGANLRSANLQDAVLWGANLRGANLSGADLRGAILIDANLRGAHLEGAVLIGTNLWVADLSGADLRGADLTDAILRGANLSGADLYDAYLSGADICDANLRGAILLQTDLRQAIYLDPEQLEGEDSPLLCNVALPEGFTVNPNRDCDRLPQELFERYPKDFETLKDAQSFVAREREESFPDEDKPSTREPDEPTPTT